MGMGWIGESVVSLKSLQIRQAFSQAITLGLIVTSALIIWKALMCITGSESPVVVVLSESMEPAFQRGDILFLSMSKDPIRAGEIVVFNIEGRPIPIVHRVIKVTIKGLQRAGTCLLVHELKDSGEDYVLTKGLFPQAEVLVPKGSVSRECTQEITITKMTGQGYYMLMDSSGFSGITSWVELWEAQDEMPKRTYAYSVISSLWFLPYVGWVTIIMTEKPIIKYILIGALGLLVIMSKD